MNLLDVTNKKMQDRLLRLIPTGEEYAISQEELSKLLGITKREVRRLIKHMRLNGRVIHSTMAGYFFPLDEIEARDCYYFHKARYKTSARILSVIEKDLRERGLLNGVE